MCVSFGPSIGDDVDVVLVVFKVVLVVIGCCCDSFDVLSCKGALIDIRLD